MTYWKLSKCGLAFCMLVQAGAAFGGQDFNYFGTEIDYWHEKSAKKAEQPSAHSTPQKENATAAPDNNERFQWQKYLDPKNKEFFKEGDYTPPEPFMEIARNPSDTNLKLWFAYIDKRNQLSERLQARMKEYLEKNGAALADPGKEYVKTKLAALPKTAPDAKRYWFRMYFDSHCPHCKRMFGTLEELRSRGYYVEAKQVDSDTRAVEATSIATQRATPEEVRKLKIESVPFLLVFDEQRKAMYPLHGYQSVASVFEAIRQGGAVN